MIPTTADANIDLKSAENQREFSNYVEIGTKNGRSFTSQLTINDFKNLVVEQVGNNDTDVMTIGSFCSSKLNFEIDKPTDSSVLSYDFNGKWIEVWCKIRYGSQYYAFYSIKIGRFKIDEIEKGNTWKFTAYDDSYWMTRNSTFPSSQSANARSVINYILSVYGIPLVDLYTKDRQLYNDLGNRTITSTELETLSNYTDREKIGYICGLLGRNGRINYTSEFVFYHYDDSNYFSVTNETVFESGFDETDDSFTLNSVTSGTEETNWTKGSGTGITYYNPIIKETDLNYVQTLLVTTPRKSWNPCTIKWRGNPRCEVGDVIRYYYDDSDNTLYKTIYITSQTINLNGGLVSDVVCLTADEDVSLDTSDYSIKTQFKAVKTDYQQAIANATKSINNANGGYIQYRYTTVGGNDVPSEILALSQQPSDGYVEGNVVRLNSNGIGFAHLTAPTPIDSIVYTDATAYDATSGSFGLVASSIVAGTISTARLDLGSIGSGISISGTQITNIDSNTKIKQLLSSTALGTCSTAMSTSPKVVNLTDYVLTEGVVFSVKFANENAMSPVYMNVNGTGSKLITYNGNNITSDMYWKSGEVVQFMYNGTSFEYLSAISVKASNDVEGTIANWCNANDTTLIDGAKIYTGSLSASKISGGVLRGCNILTNSSNYSINIANGFVDFWQGSITVADSGTVSGGTKLGSIGVGGEGATDYNRVLINSESGKGIIMKLGGTKKFSIDNNGVSLFGTSTIAGNTTIGTASTTEYSLSVIKKVSTTASMSMVKLMTHAEVGSAPYPDRGTIYFQTPVSTSSSSVGAGYLSCDGNGVLKWGTNAVTTSSTERFKTNINEYFGNATSIIKNSKIYDFFYKGDDGNADGAKKYGCIIERECPIEIVDNSGDAISVYSMTSLAWKSIQELDERIKSLEVKQ